jgi:hypothetical protein
MAAGKFPRVILTTERLVLRPFQPADAPTVHKVWSVDTYLRFAPVGLQTAGASLRPPEVGVAPSV